MCTYYFVCFVQFAQIPRSFFSLFHSFLPFLLFFPHHFHRFFNFIFTANDFVANSMLHPLGKENWLPGQQSVLVASGSDFFSRKNKIPSHFLLLGWTSLLFAWLHQFQSNHNLLDTCQKLIQKIRHDLVLVFKGNWFSCTRVISMH